MEKLRSQLIAHAVLILMSTACGYHRADVITSKLAEPSALARDLADSEFGLRFCDEVVDGLQHGSYHWLSCRKEVERLANITLTRQQMVDQICDAIKHTFERSTSVLACKQGGAELIAKG